jgi:hypothetical protein
MKPWGASIICRLLCLWCAVWPFALSKHHSQLSWVKSTKPVNQLVLPGDLTMEGRVPLQVYYQNHNTAALC